MKALLTRSFRRLGSKRDEGLGNRMATFVLRDAVLKLDEWRFRVSRGRGQRTCPRHWVWANTSVLYNEPEISAIAERAKDTKWASTSSLPWKFESVTRVHA
jgi:hypothetical protein